MRSPADVNRLVRENIGIAFFVGRRAGRGGVDVDDLVQVAALGLLRAAQRWDGEAPFAPLAFYYARAAVWRHSRRFRSIVATPSRSMPSVDVPVDVGSGDALELASVEPSPLALAEQSQEAARVRAALRALPPVDRDVLERLYYAPDASCASVGAASGIGREAMRARADRALDRLRKRLAGVVA